MMKTEGDIFWRGMSPPGRAWVNQPGETNLSHLARETAGGHRHVGHGVERVADDKDHGVGRGGRGLPGDPGNDARVGHHQVVAGHPRLAGEAAGDDHDVAAGTVRVAVAAGDQAVVADHRTGFEQVQRLALRQALDDVDEDDVSVVALDQPLGQGGADVAGADDGDLVPHGSLSQGERWTDRIVRAGRGAAGAPGDTGCGYDTITMSTKPRRPFRARPPARIVVERLSGLYPVAECALVHDGPLQLLVATILSAQCTDERVNMVTPVLFQRYADAAAYAAADPGAVEEIIRSTGFFRSKTRSIIEMSQDLVLHHGGEVPDRMPALVSRSEERRVGKE